MRGTYQGMIWAGGEPEGASGADVADTITWNIKTTRRIDSQEASEPSYHVKEQQPGQPSFW